MSRLARSVCPGVLGLFLIGFPAPAAAQEKVDLGAGYHWLRISNSHETVTMPTGWDADVAVHLSHMLAIVGRATQNYKTIDVDGKSRLYTFGAGLKISGGAAKVKPFVRVLVGDLGYRCTGGECNQDHRYVSIGGGLTCWTQSRVGFEGAVDWVHAFTPDESPKVITANANVVFKLGKS